LNRETGLVEASVQHVPVLSTSFPPVLHYDADALPQRDPRPWPARHGCLVGRLCHLEVVHASDVLHDTHARIVPGGAFCFGCSDSPCCEPRCQKGTVEIS
jgi:hypothetical protein